MRELYYLAMGFFLIIAKTTLLTPFPGLADLLSPIVVLIVYIALYQGGLHRMWVAALLGYFIDIFSGGPFGFHIVLSTAIYLLTTLPRGRVFLEGLFFQGVAVAVAILLQAFFAGLLFDMLSLERTGGFPYENVLWRMLVNGCLAIMLFTPLRKIDDKLLVLNNRRRTGISLD